MSRHDDETLLRDMLDVAENAIAAARGRQRSDLDRDIVLCAALERFVEVVGEAASRLSAQTRDEMSDVPWKEMVGMRNRLIHGYAAVDHNILWDTVRDDLPRLVERLRSALA